ncbi:DUF1281 domain-containing protein (plasmid) [Edwardsiella tarda]|uniref:DUF1281 domain-containing protein n=1 Tax=Edwardsiella TaxID=635 RepID=UPI001F2B191F|nr:MULTISPECIES: DUF1281 domain-containing protein [Edwardsiella]UJT80829.1 DUF1281 domain-containing protein [Edwardsiella piscicida]WKS83028.1 DUF1281 domain-containing protein [Edwardsiella tarda]
MPNWCANRLLFSGIRQNNDVFKTWIAGGELSLHRRAKKEGIQLFLAGCAGLLRPLTAQVYPPYPLLVSHGVDVKNQMTQAYSDWLTAFMAGAELDAETCKKLHQCWRDCHIRLARWATLSSPEQAVIEQLYRQKKYDWSDSFRPAPVNEWWDSLCDGEDAASVADPLDFCDVLPTRLDIEINGFNGGLLTGIPASYGHYVNLYGCKWPVAHEANICFAGEDTLTVDFDTPWSPVGESVVAELSQRYRCEVEHWFAEQGCNYCGYARYANGEQVESIVGELEWGETDPCDETDFSDVNGPEWIINNVAHFGG